MKDVTQFLAKIVALSAALSFAIKYGGPLLPLPEGTGRRGLAIALVTLPSLILGLGLAALAWREKAAAELK